MSSENHIHYKRRSITKPTDHIRLAVVIPCYNAAESIVKTIDSVLEQGYPNLVLIVCDDGSTDESKKVVSRYGRHVLLESGPNRGACHARNQGTKIAKSLGTTHIIYLDADDYIESGLLLGASKVALESNADIVFSKNPILHENGVLEERPLPSTGLSPLLPVHVLQQWIKGSYFNPSAVLWRIELIERINGWNESLKRAQDTDIMFRALFEKPIIMLNYSGSAVYVQKNTKSISRDESEGAIQSQLAVFSNAAFRSQHTEFDSTIPLLAQTVYAITRKAFQLGYIAVGREGIRNLHRLGFTDHPGTQLHRTVCQLIGLEWKVRLWGK